MLAAEQFRADGWMSAVHTFTHPDGCRMSVVLVADVAEPGYFAEVGARLDAFDDAGALVVYAGRIKDELPEDAAPLEHIAAALLRRAEKVRRARSGGEDVGWVFQADALPPRPKWIVTDRNALEVVQTAGALTVLDGADRHPYLVEDPPSDPTERMLWRLHAAAGRRRRWWDIPLIGAREAGRAGRLRVAFATTMMATDGEVVLVWRMDELPGLFRHLCRRGFRLTGTDWVRIGDLNALGQAYGFPGRAWSSIVGCAPGAGGVGVG